MRCPQGHEHDKIAEKYVRCFPADAVFCGLYAQQQIAVTVGGELYGIVMPIRDDGKMEPWGRNIPDSIVFHHCENDCEFCPHCNSQSI